MMKAIVMSRPYLIPFFIKGFSSLVIVAGLFFPHLIIADTAGADSQVIAKIETLTSCPIHKDLYGVKKVIKRAVITAYTDHPALTDDRPREAASGKEVFDGMVATNIFPFGTRIKIPEVYGDKIFFVEDRMNRKYNGKPHFDVFLPTYDEAKQFGAKFTQVVILQD